MGPPGTGVLVLAITIAYLIFALNVKPESFALLIKPLLNLFKRKLKEPVTESEAVAETSDEETISSESDEENLKSAQKEEEEPIEFIVRNLNEEKEDEFIEPEETEIETIAKGPIIHDLDNEVPEIP